MSQYVSDKKLVSFKVYISDQAEFVTSDVEYILVIDFIDAGKGSPELGEVFKRVGFDDSVPAFQGGSGVLVLCLGFPHPFLTDYMHSDPPSLVHGRQLYISFRDISTLAVAGVGGFVLHSLLTTFSIRSCHIGVNLGGGDALVAKQV